MIREERNDLFQSAFIELHQEAPTELIKSLRERLEHIRANNPQSAQTAEACLRGLASDKSTLLHVLTAAYLINGGVMLKHQTIDTEKEGDIDGLDDQVSGFDFGELEDELNRFSEPQQEAKLSMTTHATRSRNFLSTE